MARYSVAIVLANGDLELTVVKAVSSDEALGKAITEIDDVVNNWGIIEIPGQESKNETAATSDNCVLRYLLQGFKISAIKEYRLLHDVGLKDAKESVETMMENLVLPKRLWMRFNAARQAHLHNWRWNGMSLIGRVENHPKLGNNIITTSPVRSISPTGVVTTKSGTEYVLHDIDNAYNRITTLRAMREKVYDNDH